MLKKSITVQLSEVIVSLRGALATKQSLKDCFAKNARNDTSVGTLPNAELLQKNYSSFVFCFTSFVISAACLMFLTGCASTPISGSDPTQIPSLEPAAMLKMPDIPVPSGFVFAPEESYAFQSTNFRAGLLRYKGKGTGDQVIVFLKEQMPMYGWNLVNIVEYERRLLSFEKDQETCIITVEGKDNRSVLTVSIAPKSQASPRKTDKPIK